MRLSIKTARKMMEAADGNLDLRGTGITSLPEGLTVGGWLDLSDTGITCDELIKVKKLHDGDYSPGKWIYADGILTHVKKKRSTSISILFMWAVFWARTSFPMGNIMRTAPNCETGFLICSLSLRLIAGRINIKDFLWTRRWTLMLLCLCTGLLRGLALKGPGIL